MTQQKQNPTFILNFHGLGELTWPMPAGGQDCWLDNAVFEAVLDHVRGRPDVRITFDDANESDYAIALPLLKARNMSAQFFVGAQRVGQLGFLSVGQLRALHVQGIAIGNQGLCHRNWRRCASGNPKKSCWW